MPMRPEDVPDDLVEAWLDATCGPCDCRIRAEQGIFGHHHGDARRGLAAVLPLHEQQVRASIWASCKAEWQIRCMGTKTPIRGIKNEAEARQQLQRWRKFYGRTDCELLTRTAATPWRVVETAADGDGHE